jgi:hypothetical protein
VAFDDVKDSLNELRRSALRRALAEDDIVLPDSIIWLETGRHKTLLAAHDACHEVYRRSLKFRLKRTIMKLRRRFRW